MVIGNVRQRRGLIRGTRVTRAEFPNLACVLRRRSVGVTLHVAAATVGPAATSFFLRESTRRLRPSSERAPRRIRSAGSANTTSSVVFRTPGVDDGIPDVAIDRSPVGRAKAERFLACDAKRLQHGPRRPGK